MRTMLTGMICERYSRKYSGLEQFSQQSACLKMTGAKQGQAHLDNSFLSLVISALRVKGINVTS